MSDIPKSKRVYLVMAYRYGTNEYFYPVGVFNLYEDAVKAARKHREFRGWKYDHKVFDLILDFEYDSEEVNGVWVTGHE